MGFRKFALILPVAALIAGCQSQNKDTARQQELEQAGAFDDITQLGSGQDDIDRQLSELTSGAQVDDELAKMKAELGSGGGESPALEQGEEKA